MSEQLILTHIAALLAGIGAAYAWLVHIAGYVHPLIAELQQAVARLESRPAPILPPPAQPPVETASPTQAPPGAPPKASPICPAL